MPASTRVWCAGGCSCLGESFGRLDSLSLGDVCDDQAQLFLFTEVFTQVFSACDFVASTIAIIPTLITAGKVAHEAMTAIKSGSAGDDCASLFISTALATLGAFKYASFPRDSVTRASVFETVLLAARLGSARGRVG